MEEIVLGSLFGAVAVQRILELRLAKRNEAWAREQGAVEQGAGHYFLFFILHTGWQLGWLAEAWLRGPSLTPQWPFWAGLFLAAEGLRYWAIGSLGRAWNTRILVVPNAELVARGPYQFLRHPNYVAVVLELAAVPMIFGAWITAAVCSVLNAIILLGIRIPAENKALGRGA